MLHLTSRSDQHNVRSSFASKHDIGASPEPLASPFKHRQPLPGKDQCKGAVLPLDSQFPGLGRLGGVGGTNHRQVGHGPQRHDMLYGLMRRTIFSETDGIMRKYIEDRRLHKCTQAHGGPHVVAEYQKRCAIRPHGAM